MGLDGDLLGSDRRHKRNIPYNLIAIAIVVFVSGGVLGMYAMHVRAYEACPIRTRLMASETGIFIYDMPGDSMVDAKTIAGGIKVAIQGEFEDYYFVRLRNGVTGWVKKEYTHKLVDTREIAKAKKSMLEAIEAGKSKFQ